MSDAAISARPSAGMERREVWFAACVVCILLLLFVPAPAFLIDLGIAVSIALSILILMVALWIQKPLEFSAFPTVLLVATLLRLALNIATTRLILSHGSEGVNAAGHIIGGFSKLVMGGDFLIGLIVFGIIVTVNFVVITKGGTRIAEVGARFMLDSMPGKQMAIDADLSAGLIDEAEAQRRRRELEEESAFFGSMDGASKFVRGDAIAGIVILAVNIVGGILIGIFRHNMSFGAATDVFVKLAVGDGLVSQIPALIVSFAAGLLVSKGGTRGSAEKAMVGQMSHYPQALKVAAGLLILLALVPGLPFLPFAVLGAGLAAASVAIPRVLALVEAEKARVEAASAVAREDDPGSLRREVSSAEIELALGRQIGGAMFARQAELSSRVAKMRRRFARRFGFVIPEIRLSDEAGLGLRQYEIRIHGSAVAGGEVEVGQWLAIHGSGARPDFGGEEVREPAYGAKAVWMSDAFLPEARAAGLHVADDMSVMLTHVSEVLTNHLAQLFLYRDLRRLVANLDGEYRKLVEEVCPAMLSFSTLQAVLRLLLAERVSIRNLHLVIEAIAEIAPQARRPEQIVEHVRMRLAQQICADVADGGKVKVLRLGPQWEVALAQGVKRDAKGDIAEFDVDPATIERFAREAGVAIRPRLEAGETFAVVAAPDIRAFVRMILERMFPGLPVLSHLEIARTATLVVVGQIA